MKQKWKIAIFVFVLSIIAGVIYFLLHPRPKTTEEQAEQIFDASNFAGEVRRAANEDLKKRDGELEKAARAVVEGVAEKAP